MESKLKLMKFIYNLLNKFEALKNSVSPIEFYDFDLYLIFSSDFVKIKKFVDNCSIRKHMINPESCSCKIIKSNQFRYADLYFDFVNEKLIQDKLSIKNVITLNHSNFNNFVSSIISFNNVEHNPKIYLESSNSIIEKLKNLATSIIDFNNMKHSTKIYFVSSDFLIEKLRNNIKKLEIINNYDNETIKMFLSIINDKLSEYKNTNNDMILLGLDKQLVDNNVTEKPKMFMILYSLIKFYGSNWCRKNGQKSKNIIKHLCDATFQEYKQTDQEGHFEIYYNYIPCPDLKCCLHHVYIIFEVTNIFELLLLTETIDYIKYV